jgi:hypothetical protein
MREQIRVAREQLTATAVAHATATDEVATLRRQAQVVKAQSTSELLTATAQLETRIGELTELGARATARAARAEAMLRATEARGQHVDASLEQAIARAKAAEARVAYLDERVSVHGVLARQADDEYALARNQIVALETRLAALEASGAQTAESSTRRASEHAAELLMVAVAGEIAAVEPPSTDATKRATRIAAALADQQIRDAARRIDDADTRANAAETIAKAMAKDVAEALRRAADVEVRLRHAAVELEAANRRADRAEAEHAYAAGTIAELERRAAEAEARASQAAAEVQLATAEVRRVGSAGQTALDQVRRELAAESCARSCLRRSRELELPSSGTSSSRARSRPPITCGRSRRRPSARSRSYSASFTMHGRRSRSSRSSAIDWSPPSTTLEPSARRRTRSAKSPRSTTRAGSRSSSGAPPGSRTGSSSSNARTRSCATSWCERRAALADRTATSSAR